MEAAEHITVEVVYALPARQRILEVRVPSGSTVETALRAPEVLAEHPQIDLACVKVGIFGRRVSPKHVLHPGDRIEIYRALIADPKTARRKRAANTEGNSGAQ